MQVYDKGSIGSTHMSDATQVVVLSSATVMALQSLGFNVKSALLTPSPAGVQSLRASGTIT